MGTIADLLIRVRADTGPAEGDINRFGGKVRSGFGKALLPAAAILGGVAVAAKKTTDAATNLGESQNAVNVVFGKGAPKIRAFAKIADKEAGLSMRALNELVTPLGASFINMGDSEQVAADKSIALAKRAADMASVFNVDVSEALGAIQAGLRGEADPLERFGVGLSDAAVKAQAMSMGLAKSEKALTAQDKAQARYALLLQQTNKLQGDFKNTSDSAANAARINAAAQENLQAKIGTGLLPVVQMYQKVLGGVTGFMAEHTNVVMIAGGVLAGLATFVVLVNAAYMVTTAAQKAARAATLAWTAAQWLLNAALSANPIALVIIALVALGLAIAVAWRKSETFRNIVISAWNAVKTTTIGAFNAIKTHIGGAVDFIISLANKLPMVWLARHAIEARDDVGKAIGAIPGKIGAFIDSARNKAKEVGTAIKNGVVNAADGVADALGKVLAPIGGVVNAALGPVKAAFGALKGAVDAVAGAVRGLIDAIRSIPKPKLPNIDIPGFASGVRGFGGGLAVVGERGPELVALPRGSTVFSNAESRNMVGDARPGATGGAGGPLVNIEEQHVYNEVDPLRAASEMGRRLAVVMPS